MNWQSICDDPTLQNLPYKIETNKWGNIEMSPASNEHGLFQVAITEHLLRLATTGRPITECGIQTSAGVKVADVAWGSYGFFKIHRRANPYPRAPEIVVEIRSPSNSLAEMLEKQQLYFAVGAREFWLCTGDGRVRFFDADGERPSSALVPGFPDRIDIDFA